MDTQPSDADFQLWERDLLAAPSPAERLPARVRRMVPYICKSCLTDITDGWEHADGCDA